MNAFTFEQRSNDLVFLAILGPGEVAILERLRAALPNGITLELPAGCGDHDPIRASLFKAPELTRLTPRQRAILPLLLQDLSNKEIGRVLSISHFTVRNQVSRLLEVLAVPNRKAAIAAFAGAIANCAGQQPVTKLGKLDAKLVSAQASCLES